MHKRIAIVLPDLRLGGGQRVLLGLARQFLGFGQTVDVVAVFEDGELAAELPIGVGCHQLLPKRRQGSAWQSLNALLALVNYLRREKPDVVLSSMTGTNLLAATACMFAGSGVQLLLREAASFANLRSHLLLFLMRALYRRADALVAVSAGVANDLVDLGMDTGKIHVIHNPVDVERLRSLALEDASSTDGLERPYITSIGRLVRQKDHLTLLRAYAASSLMHSHRLVIIGDGELKHQLVRVANELGIGNHVEWLGAMRNPYAILSRASLFVLSSRWEGYPNVLLEAAGFGVPIVSTDCSDGPSELLEGGRYGRLVPVGDHLAMARAMEEELRRPAMNLEAVIQAHQPGVVAERYLNLLVGNNKKGEA